MCASEAAISQSARILSASSALLAALVFALPAAAQAQGWRCQAGALSLSVLGSPAADPVAVGSDGAECATQSANLSSALPVPLDVSAAIASTTAAANQVVAAGGVAGLRVRALPTLPVQLPAIPIPDSLGAVTVPLPSVPLVPLLPPSVTVDLRPALNALLPNRRLPTLDLLDVKGAVAYATAQCADGQPKLAGVSQVAGVTVLGQDLGTAQLVDQTLTLLDSGSIDPSDIDLNLVQIPSVTGVLDSVLQPLVKTALKPVLDALPTISIPATLASVKVTPGDQETANGVLTQHALRVQVSIAGQSIVDAAVGRASAGAAGVDCGVAEAAAGAEAVTDLSLACTKQHVTLIDVIRRGNRVKLLGAADRHYAGRTVELIFNATGKVVARAKVAADGSFDATAPLPSKGLRDSNLARYRAVIGDERSLDLKLARRMVVSEMAAHGGKVTIAGRVLGALASPVEPIVVKRRLTCSRSEKVATVKPDKHGYFSVTLKAPPGLTAAVYRLSTSVPKRRGSAKLFATYTLPRAVNLR